MTRKHLILGHLGWANRSWIWLLWSHSFPHYPQCVRTDGWDMLPERSQKPSNAGSNWTQALNKNHIIQTASSVHTCICTWEQRCIKRTILADWMRLFKVVWVPPSLPPGSFCSTDLPLWADMTWLRHEPETKPPQILESHSGLKEWCVEAALSHVALLGLKSCMMSPVWFQFCFWLLSCVLIRWM